MSLLLLSGFAVWRITALFVYDTGPWGIFARLQKLSDTLGGPLSCFWCASGWVSLVVSVAFWEGLSWRQGCVRWAAAWAMAVLIDEVRLTFFPPSAGGCDDDRS